MPTNTDWARYPTPPATFGALGLICRGLGAQSGRAPAVLDRTLDVFALVLIDAGNGRLDTADGAQPLSSGSLVVIPPGRRHSYRPDPIWSERWVLFSGPAIGVYLRTGVLDAERELVREVEVDPTLRILARMRQNLQRADRLSDLETGVGVHRLLTEIVAPARKSATDRATETVRRLRDGATASGTLSARARRLGLTPAELRELVLAETGLTPRQFLTSARMEIATGLLAGSDLPVARVAARAGYADAGYFTRHFHRYVGVSPSRFRHLHLRGAAVSDPAPPGQLSGDGTPAAPSR